MSICGDVFASSPTTWFSGLVTTGMSVRDTSTVSSPSVYFGDLLTAETDVRELVVFFGAKVSLGYGYPRAGQGRVLREGEVAVIEKRLTWEESVESQG
ncbi:unnamed protein product [Cochlearia groenlandica]